MWLKKQVYERLVWVISKENWEIKIHNNLIYRYKNE